MFALRTWADVWCGDQSTSVECVAFAWVAWLADGPVTHAQVPAVDPHELYELATKVDEYPDTEEGTSVRGGAKALKKLGLIGAYYRAPDAATVIEAVLKLGPVVVGTDWYVGMTELLDGSIAVPTGEQLDGHAYLITGAAVEDPDLAHGWLKIKSSWGREWGVDGHARIRIEDWSEVFAAGGEGWIATETGA